MHSIIIYEPCHACCYKNSTNLRHTLLNWILSMATSFILPRNLTKEYVPIPELRNEEWLQDLCFLVNITEKLNQLNMELQGQNNLITDACNLIKAFQMKLLLFESQLKNNNAQHFPLLKEWHNHNVS